MKHLPLAASLVVLAIVWFVVTYSVIYVVGWSLGALLADTESWRLAAATANMAIVLLAFAAFFFLCRLIILRR